MEDALAAGDLKTNYVTIKQLPEDMGFSLRQNKKKAQALQNKRDFDGRARENNYDLLYKNECQNWRNKINKAKKTDRFPEKRLKEMKDAFEILKKEALQRKKMIRTGECSAKEFMDWLYQQNSIIAKLTDG